ncbi:radical SAM family heme chaperone HemW [Hippea alviniae]|uniref:radical SAM family heme chaperone HemW n=1 Tax=Hippea alviniae TaxID=1279027 RepID=UPI00138ABA7B|nr:radical SAM family heme chaperone HemW [Hippea alviniae]
MSDIYFYIHIPFCYRKCPYCSFVSFEKKLSLVDEYVDALLKEIRAFKTDSIVRTVYFGGGTPTVLKIEYIDKILSEIFKRFKSDIREITIEAIPLGLKVEYLKGLKSLGVNRISLGVQSFSDFKLKKLRRLHSKEDNLKAINNVFDVGFDNVSVDLIYGVGESLGDLEGEIKYLKFYSFKHVSTYMLSIEKGTPFFDMYKNGKLKVNDDEQLADFYLFLCDALEGLGFLQYEISNFAKSGFESKHNLAYWELKEYKGFGVSASSFVDFTRFKNSEKLDIYLSNPTSCYKVEEKLDKVELAKEMLIFGLRKNEGISFSKVKTQTGVDLQKLFEHQINELVEMGFLEKELDGLKLKGCKSMSVSNAILSHFI